MIVQGALLDASGARRGYVRLRNGRIVETGAIGTDSSRGRERRIHGIVLPESVNAHSHLGDAVGSAEPPHLPLARIVAPPDGMKFRLLRESPGPAKEAAMRRALDLAVAGGTGAILDFREEGVEGAEALRRAARGRSIRTILLGRPLARPIDRGELDRLLRISDGVGLSSAREEDAATRQIVARACRAQGKRYALHASEAVRESIDSYLRPRPDLLVHMFRASAEDLEAVAREQVPVAVCPRSNALFGRVPDLAGFERAGVRFFLGTDNAMFAAPSMFRELEFAYAVCRLRRRPVAPEVLVHAAFTRPWEWLGEPNRARLSEENPGCPIVLRLPEEHPEYQVVTRGSEHLMVRPASGGRSREPA
ncbi:MAG: amidohydrolase family protein [Thermoplasmata archaeon]